MTTRDPSRFIEPKRTTPAEVEYRQALGLEEFACLAGKACPATHSCEENPDGESACLLKLSHEVKRRQDAGEVKAGR